MYVVIVGGGEAGQHLAKTLLEEGCDVVVIERDPDRADEISTQTGCLVIKGDGTRLEVLKEAEVNEADAVVVMTDTDEKNLIIGLMAKQLGARNVIVRLRQQYYDEATLKRLGIDRAIYPEMAYAEYLSEMITKPNVVDLAFVARGDAEILEMEVKPDSEVAGQRIDQIRKPSGTAIIAVIKGDRLEIPSDKTVIRPGDKILVLVKKERIDEVKKLV